MRHLRLVETALGVDHVEVVRQPAAVERLRHGGNAVVRNKIKRQVRMMVDELFDFTEKFDTIIIVRPKYHQENYGNNKKGLERLKKKVKII